MVESHSSYPSTSFPHLNQFIRKDYPLTTEAIDTWFKRCIADFPQVREYKDGDEAGNVGGHYYIDTQKWLETWFSQFQSSPTSAKEMEQ